MREMEEEDDRVMQEIDDFRKYGYVGDKRYRDWKAS